MILYYTHNAKPRAMLERFYHHHAAQAGAASQPFVAVVADPFWPSDIVQPITAGPKFVDIFERILSGLVGWPDADPCWLCEDDCLYPMERYGMFPMHPTAVYYNLNIVYLCERGFFEHARGSIALSQMFGTVGAVRGAIAKKKQQFLDGIPTSVEPCSVEPIFETEVWNQVSPSIDFRTGYNATWGVPADCVFTQLCGTIEAAKLWREFVP